MPLRICIWTPAIVAHLATHDVSQDEFEEVVSNPTFQECSDSSGRPAVIGYTGTGRLLFCVFEEINETYIEPVTAYEL
jgi:uncharacterized DUF497 family protein